MAQTKVCNKCKKRKPLSGFYKQQASKDGRQGHCSECGKKYSSDYLKKNRQMVNKKMKDYGKQHPRKILDYRLRTAHGITVDDYDSMFDEQSGVCAICGKKETHKNQYGIYRLGVDHNHITNKNRGLLCTHCNTAIGSLYVDENGIDLLLKAIEYVRKYQ